MTVDRPRIVADAELRVLSDGTVLVGGAPWRLLRLTPAGAERARRLLAGAPPSDAADVALSRRLVAAGLAHPSPEPAPFRGVVVVPAYERADGLARCLGALGPDVAVVVVDDGSIDAVSVERTVTAYGARVVRRDLNGGPAAARNSGLAVTDSDLVAFVDSDCTVTPDALAALTGHFADPTVAAVAPRIRPRSPATASWLGRFVTSRSPLDLGDRPAAVAPHGRVAYVPTTVLLVRRSAIESVGGFDEALRYGEDVDLVWRLRAAGWTVRYAPSVSAVHDEPVTWRAWLARRFRYGTSAGPLARRHRKAMSGPSLAGLAAPVMVLRRRSALPDDVARRVAVTAPVETMHGLVRWGLPLWWPALSLFARRRRPSSRVLLAGLVGVPLMAEWVQRRPALDPVRWTVAGVVDDAAYAAGVWLGCVRARTLRPVLPRLRSASDGGLRAHDEPRMQ